VDVERLGQIFEGAPLIGGHRTVQIGVCRDDDNRQPREQLADAGQQLQSAAAGHADIADQHIGTLLAAQPRHGAVGIVETYRLQAILLQGLFQYPADGAIVINDPDIGGWIHSWSPVMGRKRVKVVCPGTLSHSISPWCRLMMVWVIDRPSPVPSARPLTMG